MTADRASRLYQGLVVHRRLRPTGHVLSRRIPMILFDLDELPQLASPLLAIDRFGPLSLEARHHLAGDGTPLKDQILRRLEAAGIAAGGPIRLLCMPAVFGRVFNPLSVYFCHSADGRLTGIVYEVNNTFGGRHCYVLPVMGDREGPVRQGCAKTFHVSPFLDHDLTYAFTILPPGEHVRVGVEVSDGEGAILTASFAGAAEPLTGRALAGVLARYPLLMLQVLGAIHWEAAKMFAKGLRLRPRPPASAMGWRPGRIAVR
jgi:hypothetical protein